MKLITILATLLFTGSVFANAPSQSFTKIAECIGNDENMNMVRLVIFVNDANDSTGLLSASVDNDWDYATTTAVNWNTAEGYPRVHNNEFDLDVVISDKKSSTDDVILDNTYVEALECFYTPKKN